MNAQCRAPAGVEPATGRLAVSGCSITLYRSFEAGEQAPISESYDRICELFGWPRTFFPLRSGEGKSEECCFRSKGTSWGL
jgi:hypothetical protein